MVTQSTASERQLAVLIDFENVGLDSIQELFDQLSDVGRITVKRAYADWSSTGGKRNQLLELGIEPIQVFHASQGGKNSSDIRLAVDAVDLLYQSPVDTFVIVSSDSDFVSLVSRLRAAGKTVIGAGRQETAPPSLVISCDRYVYLEAPSRRRQRTRSGRAQRQGGLLTRAVEASMDDQGVVMGSRLHETVRRLDPSFDYRRLGHSTFTKYLMASPEVKVSRPRGTTDTVVELADAGPRVVEPIEQQADWQQEIDLAWSNRASRPGQRIAGPNAASDAAKFLGVSKLSASRYKTLQGLLDASERLRAHWRRDGNMIIRREQGE